VQSVTDFEIVVANQTEPIDIMVTDTITEEHINVVSNRDSSFRLVNIADDSLEDSGTFRAAGSAAMVRVDTGIYQYSFDASTYDGNYVLFVTCALENGTVRNNMYVKSASARQFAYASQLRLQVDKARKSVRDEIANMDRSAANFDPAIQFFYGYGDKHMLFYLERGVQYLNAISPYTGLTVDTFPFSQYGSILIDAATIAALESQAIFAIDTDFSYSLGGNSLVIDHFTKLSSMVSAILGRFTKTAISWKQQYRSQGLVMFQWMPGGVRAARQLNSMPSGWWSRMLSSVYI
jgi:hypothetical protein